MKYSHALYAALALTLISLVVCIWLAVWGPANVQTQSLFETCSTTWKMGFGAIIGLIASRHLPDATRDAA